MLEKLKNEVCRANLLLKEYGLISLTWGNVSGIDREKGLVVIKPSGVSYENMKPSDMVVVRLSDGETVEGNLNPSSDTPTHLELYRNFPGIAGVVHTHSVHATAYAQQHKPIPAEGTTHADHFYGDIPVTRDLTAEEIKGEYELNTGKVIVERFASLDPDAIPAVLVASHGVFAWGKSPEKAVENALVTEKVAEMGIYGSAISYRKHHIKQVLLDKHYLRKHGENAYYGQIKKAPVLSGAEEKFEKIAGNHGVCTCGRTHEISLKYLKMHSGAIKDLPGIIRKVGDFRHIVMICDENTYKAAGKTVEELCTLAKTVCLNPDNLHANEKGVAAAEIRMIPECDLLLAVGSGTVHDITRYIAYNKKIPFISVPTAASVDGFVSTVAAMTWNGAKKTFTAVGPTAMVADSDIIAASPKRMTASGVGDLLGKYTALLDWKIARTLTNEYYCPEIVRIEEEAVKEIVDNIDLIASGDVKAIEKLMYGLVLSGLAMQMSGNSRPASGAEHHISHCIEMSVFNPFNEALHGEKVGVATGLVCDKYHEIATYAAENLPFSIDKKMGDDEIRETFGTLAEEIIKENAKDVMAGVSKEVLIEKWKEIRKLIDELPSGDTVRDLLCRCGGSTTLTDIRLPEELLPKLYRYSPMVRARLTLMRIAGYFAN